MADAHDNIDRKVPYPDHIQAGHHMSSNLPTEHNFNRELLRVKAHWVTDLFPDELVVQEKTISMIRNQFLTSYVETIPIRDIGRVVYIDTPFFAGIQVLGKNTAHELHVGGLNKAKAMNAKQLIEALLLESAGEIEITDWVNKSAHAHADALRHARYQHYNQPSHKDKRNEK